MKKIFVVTILGFLTGLPLLVLSAGSCTPDTWRTTQLNCVQSGGTWTKADGTKVDSSGSVSSPVDNLQVKPSGSSQDNIRVVSGLSANTKLQNPIKYSTFSDFAAAVTKTAVQILMPFIVLAFIYSGFLFVKAQGNVAELEKAKTAIIYSMIGAFILLGAWGFAQIIGQTVSTLTQ